MDFWCAKKKYLDRLNAFNIFPRSKLYLSTCRKRLRLINKIKAVYLNLQCFKHFTLARPSSLPLSCMYICTYTFQECSYKVKIITIKQKKYYKTRHINCNSSWNKITRKSEHDSRRAFYRKIAAIKCRNFSIILS